MTVSASRESIKAPSISDDLASLSELANKIAEIYAERFGTPRDSAWTLMKLSEELGEVHSAWLKLHGQSRGTATEQDLEDEIADLLGFLLVFAAREGVDAGTALRRKWGAYLPEEKT